MLIPLQCQCTVHTNFFLIIIYHFQWHRYEFCRESVSDDEDSEGEPVDQPLVLEWQETSPEQTESFHQKNLKLNPKKKNEKSSSKKLTLDVVAEALFPDIESIRFVEYIALFLRRNKRLKLTSTKMVRINSYYTINSDWIYSNHIFRTKNLQKTMNIFRLLKKTKVPFRNSLRQKLKWKIRSSRNKVVLFSTRIKIPTFQQIWIWRPSTTTTKVSLGRIGGRKY